jgi:DedD protein
MGLQDIFTKRDSAGATQGSASASVMTGEQAEQARLRARRRLIGAVVLLGIGVIAFPLLFETQPRPIAVDIPIVIPPRDGVPPLALPAPKVVTKPAASAPVAAAPAASSAEPAPVVATPASAATPPAPKPVVKVSEPATPPKPAVAVAPPPTPASVAKAAVEPAKPAATATGRFVVQIGAFAETAAVRDVRSKAQKAGLVTFTQTVDTADGKRTRVRVGPFASREEAEKAAAQAKAAGLGGSVLTL